MLLSLTAQLHQQKLIQISLFQIQRLTQDTAV